MGGLMSNLFGNVIEWLLGESIEKVGDSRANRWVRGTGVILMFVLSAGIAVTGTLFWTSQRHPGITGLWQWVEQGGPAWVLAAPVCAALTVLLLLLPVPGKFTPIAFTSFATFGFSLGALAVFQGGGRYAVASIAVGSIIAAVLLPIIGLMLAMGEVPPLDAPLARFAMTYWGRRRHLLALRAWGQAHDWQVSLPGGARPALTIQGRYDPAYPVVATSSADLGMRQGGSFVFSLSVKMSSPYDIVAFRISADPPPAKARGRVATGTLRTGFGRAIHYYVVPLPAYPLPDGFMDRLRMVVEAGRGYFGKLDFAHATPFGLRYTHKTGRRLTVRDANLDPLLGWMSTLCGLLEEVSPRPATAGAPTPASQPNPPNSEASAPLDMG